MPAGPTRPRTRPRADSGLRGPHPPPPPMDTHPSRSLYRSASARSKNRLRTDFRGGRGRRTRGFPFVDIIYIALAAGWVRVRVGPRPTALWDPFCTLRFSGAAGGERGERAREHCMEGKGGRRGAPTLQCKAEGKESCERDGADMGKRLGQPTRCVGNTCLRRACYHPGSLVQRSQRPRHLFG